VKVSGDYTVFYRRHYFELRRKTIEAASHAHASNPLLPQMGHGLPNSAGIPYRLEVVPIVMQPGPGAVPVGENAQLTGKLTRYDVEFQLQATGLRLPPDADGTRRKSLQVALVVYGKDFKPRNWEIREIHLSIKPEEWAAKQSVGIPFHPEISAPSGDVYLRTGVYDSSSSKVGTLEILLSAVTIVQK
jgi:hypothetical protein